MTKNFVTKYKEKTGDIPNQFAADAYDAIYIIKAAIEKANITPDASVSDICDALKKAITEIEVDGLTGADMTWVATGEVNKAPMAVIIENGTYVSAK
jgi:branched-chain amino acid transport system substrate-binding protein